VELRPGIPLALAPRFQSSLPWIDRVEINGGVEEEAGHFYPRRDWRRPRAAELALLLADREAPPVRLVNLPPHVRRAWWALGDLDGAAPGAGESSRAFVDGVTEFLHFKQMPLADRCRVDVVVSRPGQPSTRWDAVSGCPGGLAFNLAPGAARVERVDGVINLGDEATHLVLLNLTPAAMADMLGREPGDGPPDPGLLRRFFAACPEYPLIRVRLPAGDGVWLPTPGIVYDTCTLDQREVDVVLTVRAEMAGAREGCPRPARL
jgi:hypothetical protein